MKYLVKANFSAGTRAEPIEGVKGEIISISSPFIPELIGAGLIEAVAVSEPAKVEAPKHEKPVKPKPHGKH